MSTSTPTHPVPPYLLAALLLAFALISCGSDGLGAPDRIFLVTVDTLRADHVEFQGYPAETTPFLSKLAEESAVFTNAFSSCRCSALSFTTYFEGRPITHLICKGE